jgi:hypothetical protein
MPKLKGSISIGRMLNSGVDRCVVIELEDDSSGTRVVSIHLTPHDLAMALTGSGCNPCEFDWPTSPHVGKVHEHKQVAVWIPQVAKSVTREIIRIAVAKYEVDGWKGYDEDALNWHRHVDPQPPPPALAGPGDWRQIGYIRFVDRRIDTQTEEESDKR